MEKELNELQKRLTPEQRLAVFQAQMDFAKSAVETRHINPISLHSQTHPLTPRRNQKHNACTAPNYVVNAPSSIRRAAQAAAHNLQHHETRRHRRAAAATAASPPPTTATSSTKSHPTPAASPAVPATGETAPAPAVTESDYVAGSDAWFREHVPQETHYAHLVGFASHTVMLELRKAASVVGRQTAIFTPDLDLSQVVRFPKRVSHSHLAIEWDTVPASFRARVLSTNGAVIDGTWHKEGVVPLGNGSVIRVQNFEMTLVLPHDMTRPL